MEKVSVTVTGLIDKLPAYGTKGKVEVFSGLPAKLLLLVAAAETVLSLGSWDRFGWTLVLQLVILTAGLYVNRNGYGSFVWAAVLASIVAGPLARRFTGGPWALW